MRAVALLVCATGVTAYRYGPGATGLNTPGTQPGELPPLPEFNSLQTQEPLPFPKVPHQAIRMNGPHGLDHWGNHDDVTERHRALRMARKIIIQQKDRTLELAKMKEEERRKRINQLYHRIVAPFHHQIEEAEDDEKGPAEATAHEKMVAARNAFENKVHQIQADTRTKVDAVEKEKTQALNALKLSFEDKVKQCKSAAASARGSAAGEAEVRMAKTATGDSVLPLAALAAVAAAAAMFIRSRTSSAASADGKQYGTL